MPADPVIETYDRQFFDPRLYDVLRTVTGRAARVLEVPCSGGSGLSLLSREEGCVTGVDIEPEMIACARARHERRGQARLRVGLVLGDLIRLPFRAAFDLVVVPREALQLVAATVPLDVVLRSVAACLAPGGATALDLYDIRHPGIQRDPCRPAYLDGVDKAGVGVARDWTGSSGGTAIRRQTRVHGLWQAATFSVVHHYTLTTADSVSFIEREVVMRHLDLGLITDAARRAGLSVTSLLHGYGRDARAAGSGRRVLLLRTS